MIEIKEKVINYMKKNNFIGIVLKKEIQSFGWAGCRDVIQGEFIKDIEEIKNKDFQYEIINHPKFISGDIDTGFIESIKD